MYTHQQETSQENPPPSKSLPNYLPNFVDFRQFHYDPVLDATMACSFTLTQKIVPKGK